jgi:phosphopantetheinyl transferase (holo-ACP synthase)
LPPGNDVVDLRDPETQPGAIHRRWESRVFAPEERGHVLDDPSPHRARWRLWAAKESAFKVAARIQPALEFHPSKFVVELLDGVNALVRHEAGRFSVRLNESEERVHAVATVEGSRLPEWAIETLDLARDGAGTAIDLARSVPSLASAQVRLLAQRAIGAAIRVDPATIEISSRPGVPVVSRAGAPLPVALSLSHHGRFLACAWVPTEA